ncbi:MAG TPA: LLM class flavin-dependent oxidoreductase [Anaerolineae bacterium]|nr:LLM class flavin-dependent oxidoreductase [Anaerolineae bacterium]
MHFGIHVPTFADYADARLLADLAREAEIAGWEGFFLWDQIAVDWPVPVVDTTVALAAIALNTDRIRFGPLITPLARRRPWKVARETATLDRLSSGRLILGVGLGDGAQEFDNLGERADRRARGVMLDEALEVVTGLWRGEAFDYEGTHYSIKQAFFTPRPMQSPRIPIWVAGVWPNKRPFRRAARWDGVFPLWREQFFNQMMPVERVKEAVAFVRERRSAETPFDIAHWGLTSGTDQAQNADTVATYAEAGVTWWLENISPWRFGWEKGAWPLEAMWERIRQGPFGSASIVAARSTPHRG